MKKINFLLALGFMGVMLSVIPVETNAANPSEMAESQSLTVKVTTPGTFASELLKLVSQWSEVESLTVIGSLNEEEMELFSRLSQLQELDLSQTDITIVTGCHGLTKLSTVLLPSTVTEIGSSAFLGCSNLSSINTPNVITIGGSAFNGCTSLKTINLPKTTEIAGAAFLGSGLTSISLPVVKEIGSGAFNYCISLKSISIPEVEIIGEDVFDRTAITEISIPKVISIGRSCFYECTSLKKVILSEELEVIPSDCFDYCQNLTTIKFPSSLKSIESRAFSNTAITTAILPEGLQTISYSAFRYTPLITISIPSTIQSIGEAFDGCTNIKDVYCYAIVPPNTGAFTSSNLTGATLHVPTFSLTSYMLDNNWYRFNQTVAIDGRLSKLTVDQAFTIHTYDGLEDKIDLDLTQQGHLTVSAGSTLNLGTYTQKQNVLSNYSYYRNICSTLIAENEMKADNVNLHLQVQTNMWNFISFPFDVNVADIEYPEGTLWVIRKYSGADRAAQTGNTWQNMTNGMMLQAGEGYILHCANDSTSTVEFVFHPVNNENKNGLFAHKDVVKSLNSYNSEYAHNRSWNLVGNPYPAYFDIHNIEHNGVITVYENTSYYGSGSYTAYSLLDDDYVLRPHEAFFVQCPIDATSMTFKAEGRQHETIDNNYYYSHTRKAGDATNSNRLVYNFTLTGGEFADRARLVINPQAKMDYEISCDASKFMSDDSSVPQIYVYDNGIRYAIDERPLGDGIINIGTRFGHTGDYTLQLNNNPSNGISVMLTDNETGETTNLAEEAYTFTAQAGTNDRRFTIAIGDEVTGIHSIDNVQPVSEDGIYDLQGRKVNTQLQKGIFIIKENGKSRKVVK